MLFLLPLLVLMFAVSLLAVGAKTMEVGLSARALVVADELLSSLAPELLDEVSLLLCFSLHKSLVFRCVAWLFLFP